MQARVRAQLAILRRFWTWWRFTLLSFGAVLLAVAVSVDSRWLAVVAAIASIVPFALLGAMVGDRVRAHHEQLRELTSRIDGLGRLDGGVARRLESAQVDALAAVAAQSHRVAEMPGVGDLSLLIRLDTDDVPGSRSLLDQLGAALVTTECIAVIDGRHRHADELAGIVISLMERWPGLRIQLAEAYEGADWFDHVRAGAQGRHLLPVDASQPAQADIAAIVELALTQPAPDEPWVGARVGSGGGLVSYRRSALDEVGGRRAVDAETTPIESRLVGAGYLVDTVAQPTPTSMIEPTARPVRRSLRIDDPHHELAGHVAAVPMAGYHCDEIVPLADRLADAGIPTGLLLADAWHDTVVASLGRCRHPVFAQPPAGAWLAKLAALVVMNDWDAELAPLIDTAASYGVPTIAKVEGAQDFFDDDVPIARNAYGRAAHVLCQGPNDVTALAGRRTHVVGSSRLERIWLAPPRPLPERRLAVINLNFTHGVLVDAREHFLRSAIEACERAGIDHVVSAHPHQRDGLEGLPLADEPMRHLLRRASVLVSRFSTVPFEAMALGVPFIYHNPHGETVPTFSDPGGAFDTSTDSAELVAALAEALGWEDRYRDRCAEFFRRQVDIDPTRSSEERAAEVMRSILREVD